MYIFYHPELHEQQSNITLTESEAHHALHVLRLKSGTPVQVMNGRGLLASGLLHTAKKNCSVSLQTIYTQQPAPKPVRLIIAPPKTKDRLHFMLEKLTELQVHEITLTRTANSERNTVRLDKLKYQLIAACKQSGNAYLPELMLHKNLQESIESTQDYQRFIAYTPRRDSDQLVRQTLSSTATALFIGPEGGFLPEEVDLCERNGIQPVGLGPLRLRTETAAIYGLATIQTLMP